MIPGDKPNIADYDQEQLARVALVQTIAAIIKDITSTITGVTFMICLTAIGCSLLLR